MTHPTRRRLLQCGAAVATGAYTLPRFAHAAEFNYKYGNNLPPSHPLNLAAKKATDRIREESDGRLDIQVFPSSQLGADTEMMSQVRSGALEFYTQSGLVLANIVPVAGINGIGFAFKDYDTLWAAMDGDLGAHVRAQIEKVGIVPMRRIWDNGFRHVTNNTRPINTPDDLKGMKIRVPVSPIWISLFKSFGTSPAAINFAEVYTALQTRIVDGQENPLTLLESAKLYEVQKYCSLTNHMWDGYWFVANRRAWDRLPEKLRDVAARHLDAAAEEERAMLRALDRDVKAKLQSHGMVFNTPDTRAFRTVLEESGFYAEWKGKFGAEAWSLLEKYSGKLG